MKNVTIITQDIEAINALYDNVDAITERITNHHYQGTVVSWKCITKMHVSVCRGLLKNTICGVSLSTAVALIDRLAQAYALTYFTLEAYGEGWQYRDDLKAFASRCDRLRAGVYCAIQKVN